MSIKIGFKDRGFLSKPVHIERLIRLAKIFKILNLPPKSKKKKNKNKQIKFLWYVL